MHPNAYLNTYWRLDLVPQVFVAMSFATEYEKRYLNVFKPAIESITVNGKNLTAYRVNNSKTGDSILTDIMEGVAHSNIILADVSSIGRDSKTGESYRNGNVLYELGLALACRQPQEVLLIRDDKEKFLFDVSTIPHMHIDFADEGTAKSLIHEELKSRLRETKYYKDARVKIAISKLSSEEVLFLKRTYNYSKNTVWGSELKNIATWQSIAVPRLLDKLIIRISGEFENGNIAYQFTELGWIIQQYLKYGLRKIPLPKEEVLEPSKA